MTTFTEAYQARLILKMKLSNYAWYKGVSVVTSEDGYAILVSVTYTNPIIEKNIPKHQSGVAVKIEVDK